MTATPPPNFTTMTRGALRDEKVRYERLLHDAWTACDQMALTDPALAARYEARFMVRLSEYMVLCNVLQRRG